MNRAPKVAIIARSFCRTPELCARAHESLPDVQLIFAPGDHELSGPEWTELAQGCVGAIIGKEPVDTEALKRVPELKAIAKYGVGLDNIDQEALARAGIVLLHEAGVNAAGVAEYTLGLMLALCRRIAAGSRNLHSGHWKKDGGVQLTGKTVLIVGCGQVGSRVGRLLKAFGCQVLINDIEDRSALAQELGGQCVNLESGLTTADFVTLHVPLTKATKNLFHRETLAKMKPTAYLINTSRGAVVDQEGMIEALVNRTIGGAACDVFAEEPLRDLRLASLDNFVGTPHSAGNAREQVEAMGGAALKLLRKFLIDSVK